MGQWETVFYKKSFLLMLKRWVLRNMRFSVENGLLKHYLIISFDYNQIGTFYFFEPIKVPLYIKLLFDPFNLEIATYLGQSLADWTPPKLIDRPAPQKCHFDQV